MQLETVKVSDGKDSFMTINKADYDASKHVLYEAKKKDADKDKDKEKDKDADKGKDKGK